MTQSLNHYEKLLSRSHSNYLAQISIEMTDANNQINNVLSPTNEEMRVLSKVFGIHPLTTEDILMEETREKIELFQNYYLVSFRSFDQNPYSPTYLEPINFYIIVFREGTLSVHTLSLLSIFGCETNADDRLVGR